MFLRSEHRKKKKSGRVTNQRPSLLLVVSNLPWFLSSPEPHRRRRPPGSCWFNPRAANPRETAAPTRAPPVTGIPPFHPGRRRLPGSRRSIPGAVGQRDLAAPFPHAATPHSRGLLVLASRSPAIPRAEVHEEKFQAFDSTLSLAFPRWLHRGARSSCICEQATPVGSSIY